MKKGDEIEIHFYEFYGAQSRMIAKVNGKELYYVKQDHPFNKTLEKFIGIGILNGHAIYMVYCAYREYVQGGRKKRKRLVHNYLCYGRNIWTPSMDNL